MLPPAIVGSPFPAAALVVGATAAQWDAFSAWFGVATLVVGTAFVAHFGGRLWMRLQSRVADRVTPLLPDDVGLHTESLRRLSVEVQGADPAVAFGVRDPSVGVLPAADWTSQRTGDRAFDDAVACVGDPLRLRSLLDAETRTLLIECFAWGGTVEAGAVRAGLARFDAHHVRDRVALARRVASRLDPVPVAEVPDRLAQIALADPVADVRRFALLALATVATPGTLEPVAARLLLDPDPLVRVYACVHAGPDGAEKLLALRRHKHPAVRAAAIRVTAQLPDAVAALTAHLAYDGDPALVAEALGLTGSPAAEATLLALLADPEVRTAAAHALGEVGTISAVEPLLAQRVAPYTGAITAAIARIQARVGSADRGRLSLAEAAGGEVSLAHEAGQVALADLPPPKAPAG